MFRFRIGKDVAFVAICVFYCSWVVNCAENDSGGDGDSPLKSWDELQKKAGYFTNSGKWRGGLFLSARGTNLATYECKAAAAAQSNDTFCASWASTEDSTDEDENGLCLCTSDEEDDDVQFCSRWHCGWRPPPSAIDTREEGKNCVEPDPDEPSDCLLREDRGMKCQCERASEEGKYCVEWSCEGTTINGDYKVEDHSCFVEDESGNFCFWWKSYTVSEKELESSVCRCSGRNERYCEYWKCQQREIYLCRTKAGWCVLGVSLGIAGSCGFLGLAVAIVFSFKAANGRSFLFWQGIFVPALLSLCFPWLAGVAVWGGVDGLLYVSIMWGVPIAIAYFHAASIFIFKPRPPPQRPKPKDPGPDKNNAAATPVVPKRSMQHRIVVD